MRFFNNIFRRSADARSRYHAALVNKMTIAIQIFVCVLFFASFVCGEILTENAAGLFKSNARSKTKNLRARSQVFDDFFNVYDPTFLAVVWPKLKNGVHLNIEPQCWDHLSRFYKDLLDGKPWAYTGK